MKTMAIKIIPENNIDWTPVIGIFTIVGGILSGWWAYLKLLFKDKAEIRVNNAKQAQDILAAFVTKLVNDRIDISITSQDKRIDKMQFELEEKLREFKQDFKEYTQSMQAQIKDIHNGIDDVYRDMGKK